MRWLEFWIFLGFAIAFTAGLTVGRLNFFTPAPAAQPVVPAAKPDDHFPTLGRQLNLSPEQKKEMEALWKETQAETDKLRQSMAEDNEARKAEISAMLNTPELAAEYRKIQETHNANGEKFRAAIARRLADTDAKTRSLLTPVQLKRFDEMARDHRRHFGPPPMGGPQGPGPGPNFGPHHFHHRGPETRPDSGPSERQL